MRAYSHQGHGPRADQQAGYISATSHSTPHLRRAAGSLIAAPSSRLSFTLPARVMVLFAVSASCRNIWSGPEHRHCKVHNGLTLTRAQRLAAQLPTPSPWGDACSQILRVSMATPQRSAVPSGTAHQIARHCAGSRTACELRLPVPCPNPSVARSPRPNPSGTEIASPDGG